MSKLDLIRAGHTEVADGQCGLCDVPWPCDTGVVLAALDAEQRARYEVDVSTGPRFMIDLTSGEIEDLRRQLAAAEASAEQAERERDDWKDAYERLSARKNQQSDEALALMQLFGEQRQVAEQHNAALRERLATVEAALTAAHGIIHEGLHGGRATDPDHQARCEKSACRRARAALAAPPAAVPDEDVAMILPPVMTFGKRQSLPDFDCREQQQHGGEG